MMACLPSTFDVFTRRSVNSVMMSMACVMLFDVRNPVNKIIAVTIMKPLSTVKRTKTSQRLKADWISAICGLANDFYFSIMKMK